VSAPVDASIEQLILLCKLKHGRQMWAIEFDASVEARAHPSYYTRLNGSHWLIQA
jgi:hypothetical protein